MTDRPNRQILLVERPSGKLEESHFKAVDGTIGEPGPGNGRTQISPRPVVSASKATHLPSPLIVGMYDVLLPAVAVVPSSRLMRIVVLVWLS